MHPRALRFSTFAARVALAAAFTSAVADRLGLWGAPGTPGVAWGDWATFVDYTGQLSPWCPTAIVPVLATVVTIVELVLALMLLAGLRLRVAAWASAGLLGLFALAMTVTLGPKAPLDYSVFSAAAAAALLASVSGGRSRPDD